MERRDKELNRAHYDLHAADDRARAKLEPNRLHSLEVVVPWVVAALPADARLIDIAGGSGAHASAIVRSSSISVVGIDISETMIQQRLEDPLLRENLVGDMEALPFESETFDGALFVSALHHVPDPLPALREAWRVLRPGGALFVCEPNSLRARREGVAPIPEHPKEFRITVGWLTARIRDAGFEITEARTRRLSIRVFDLFMPSAGLGVFHLTDRIDRVLLAIPGLGGLGGVAMVRATKPVQGQSP